MMPLHSLIGDWHSGNASHSEFNAVLKLMAITPVFRVIFQNQGEVFEVYARQIFQSELWGFIELEELVFGERSQVLVDPAEEKLKSAFEGVKRSYVPMNNIIRIDEVEKEGTSKISKAKPNSNVRPFPGIPVPFEDE